MFELNIKWNKDFYLINDLTENSTILNLKFKLFELTSVLPGRQKIMGIKVKFLKDNDTLGSLGIKNRAKLMMLGCNDTIEEIEVDDVVNDLDNVNNEIVCHSLRKENIEKVDKRVSTYQINLLNPPRLGKNLLVLDIDGTIFDHKSFGEKGSDLMRPYLHEFLSMIDEYFDICIWSATHIKYIESKLMHLGITMIPTNEAHNYNTYDKSNSKIIFILDHSAMINIYTEGDGLIEVKPLRLIWKKLEEFYNPNNTIIVDDCRKNFLMNPQNGLKIYPYRNTYIPDENKDEDLLWLGQYLVFIAQEYGFNFSTLDHRNWKKFIKSQNRKSINK